MANPPVLPLDSDVLFQILFCGELSPLRILKSKYGIQPVVLPEVHLEFHRTFNHISKVAGPKFDKALNNNVIQLLDEDCFNKLAPTPRKTTYSEIISHSRQYLRAGGPGEAQTHSAGRCMGIPTASHDMTAIKAIQNLSLDLPSPIFRLFDLVAVCSQTNSMGLKACEDIRDRLFATLKTPKKEWLPPEFERTSFAKGLQLFIPRLQCSSAPALPTANTKTSGIDKLFLISPI